MRNCTHNDVVGFSNRWFPDNGFECSYDRNLVEKLLDEFADHIIKLNGGKKLRPLTLEEFLGTRSGHSKRRYVRAFNTILAKGFDPIKCSLIEVFIKNEKYSEFKPPRMILGRDPRFNLLYGRFTVPLEQLAILVPGINKGKTLFDMGKFMEGAKGVYKFGLCDFSKYESSQRPELLFHMEMGIFNRIFDDEFLWILDLLFNLKLIKRGFTKNGVYFSFVGCRGSGDMDTWLFNTILNWVMIRYFEELNNIPKYSFNCTGDDSVMKIPRHINPVSTFDQFGIAAKFSVVIDPYEVEFCSAKYLEYEKGKFVLCPDLNKLLGNIGTLINGDFKKSVGHFYYSLGYMYKVMFPDFPFFTELSEYLMSITENPRVKHVNVDHFAHMNPMYLEALKSMPTSGKINVDKKLFEVEIWLSFGLHRAELNHIFASMQEEKPDISGRDDKYNKKGKNEGRMCSDLINVVQLGMENSLYRQSNAIRARTDVAMRRTKRSVVRFC